MPNLPAGLDTASRPKLLHLLHKLHQTRKPRVILGLRTRDNIPSWITHIALVQDGTVKAGEKDAIAPLIINKYDSSLVHHSSATLAPGDASGEIVLDLKNVNVKYSDRVVSKCCCTFSLQLSLSICARFSTTSIGRSDKASGGTSKAQTVRLQSLPPVFHFPLTNIFNRVRKNDTSLAHPRRPSTILHPKTPPPALSTTLTFNLTPTARLRATIHIKSPQTDTNRHPPPNNRCSLSRTIRRLPSSISRNDRTGSHRNGFRRRFRSSFP